ncbi:hypothetical protein SDRG_06299 [Saprolegnia diclina VS20]|uniref:Uncharacterized protein n=1 Tax=Saprolegnia diclina (strain VS20) TaxID=1156394 RepID=T0S0J1_SAPDV|nr:hypothetical protein SDRG_06299 [Saprolegnia diclina VS20]EQC36187.1 hypothetical protein SDRG_06299 [Saprolegnia diclina VS20]|eukprot:XP_008610293.1 hypothetical protein SDRG_06299 [Saprolegnia diclina VS20]
MHDTQARIVQRLSKDHDLQRRRFAETLEHLCTARAALDLADTLVVENGEVVRWFTGYRDHGVVAKSSADLHRIPIKRAFVKSCLRLESNVSRKLALLHQVRENGETTFRILHDLEFNATLCNPNAREWMVTRFVTRHVAGKFGPASATHACRFSRAATRLQTYVRFYRPPQFFFGTELTPDEKGLQFPLEHHMLHCVKELASPCNQLVQELTMRVVHAIEASSSHQVVHIQTDFVLTASDDLVLVRVAEIVYASDVRNPPQGTAKALASKPVVSPRRLFSCPGAFCMEHPPGSCPNGDDETTYAVAKKSIVWADHESHLLMRAQGTTTRYQSGATNQALVVALAQSYSSIEKIETIEKLLSRRNTVLEELQWFSNHGPALETTLPMEDLYNSVRVCADCCTMYQTLDEARRHRSSRPRKELNDVREASARVVELAMPKHRPKSSGALSVEKRRQPKKLSKCLSGPAPFWRPPDESPPPSRSTTPLPTY